MGKTIKEIPPKRKIKGYKRETKLLPEGNKNRFNKPIFHLILIIGVGVLAYSNTFHAPFQWDEHDFLVKNPIVKNLKYFLEPSKAKAGDPDFYFFLRTRYIAYLTFAINYKIHGFNVLGYHIFNLTVHLFSALLVYLLIFLTFQTPFLNKAVLKKGSNLIALFSTLIFVSHPLQTEAVTYIYQRLASLVTFFYLLSIVSYIRGRLCLDNQNISYFKPALFFILSLISTVLAMKTKENAFTLPLMILIYEIFFFSGKMKTRVLRLLPWILSMMIIPLTMIGTDKSITELYRLILDPFLYVRAELSREVNLFTQFRVVLTYIRLLFLPIHQNLDYDYPVFHSFFNPHVFLSLFFHLVVIGIGFYLLHRSRPTIPEFRLISFGIFWFYISLSIESGIIAAVITIFEYRVYLPSVGWTIATTTSVWIALEKLRPRFPGIKKKVVFFFVFIVILLSILTYARNDLWKDEARLWEDVVTKSPNKSRGHFMLGLILGKKGHFDDAIREFQTALKIEPNQARVHNNLALIYASQGNLDQAIKEFQTALTINPKDAVVHFNLGMLLKQIGRLDESVTAFQNTLKLNPLDASAHNNLGVVLALQGRLDEAIKEFKTALEIEPDHRNARNNLNKVYNK